MRCSRSIFSRASVLALRCPSCRISGLYEVDRDPALSWPQHVGRNLDDPGEGRGFADCPDALWGVAIVGPKVLTSAERARQRLAPLWREDLMIIALHVQGAVEVVTRVRVPVSLAGWEHDKNSPFRERRTHSVNQRSGPSLTATAYRCS